MNGLPVRVALLFALFAVTPVALGALVWVGLAQSGDVDVAGIELAKRYLQALDAQRASAVERLCFDDLAIDALLESQRTNTEPRLDFRRLFGAAMRGSGLQVLWILDTTTGRILARGHRRNVFGGEGAALLNQTGQAVIRPVLLNLGNERALVRACTIERAGASVTVVGGHYLSKARELAPEQIVFSEEPTAQRLLLDELVDAEGNRAGVLFWRSRIDPRPPPLALWLGVITVLAIGLGLALGGYLRRGLLDSLNELTQAANRVGAGDLETTVDDRGNRAFRATTTAFNQMTHELRVARRELRQTERVAAWQDIAKRLAHELKNPLSPIRLSIETLRKARARSAADFDDLFEESTATVLQEVDRLREIVDQFARFARLPDPKLRRCDLVDVVSQAMSLYAESEVLTTLDLPENPVEARVDPEQITQVLHNLVQNAVCAAQEAHPSGGAKVAIEIRVREDRAVLSVDDNGKGIPREQMSQIFEPYFTTKDTGTGLGLAISQRIVREHGGHIEVESTSGRTRFSVVLPRLA